MANRYGSENYVLEFRDLQATTMSLDRSGRFALLAGRKYLAVLSLDAAASDKLQVRVPYGGKYEISCTQWCKSAEVSRNIAVASSQRCDIFELTDSSELKCMARLKGHTRVITDLDWSSLQPSLLATSSSDSYVHVWDVKARNHSEKPQFSLSALDGASQVRWNRRTDHILASCDGGHVKIWDLRKPNTPSEFIAAHASKINGLEWANNDTIITAAQDCTVKFSKLAAENPTKAKGPILSLTAPVWRARPAPFGRGVITQCVPILRRDSGLLSLWDWRRFSSPIFTFQSYDIIEFAWRKNPNYDLLTWSRDQMLRIWTLPREIVQLCGGEDDDSNLSQSGLFYDDCSIEAERGVELIEDEESPPATPEASSTPTIKFERKRSILERRSRKSSSPSPMTKRDELLKSEFERIEADKPENINFDQVELERGLLRFSWVIKPTDSKSRGVTAGILASFPIGYPSAPPAFLVTNASNEVDKNHVVKVLRNVAQQYAKKHESCLAACINQFSTLMKSVKTLEDIDSFFPTRGVSNVPFPRTSGARFCAVGVLVCFGRPSYLKKVKSNCDAGTPRSLSALPVYLSQVALTRENEDGRNLRRLRRHERKRAGLVTIFDVSPLLPFNMQLAESYKHLVSSPSLRRGACLENAAIANSHNKKHVAFVWQACSIISGFAHPSKPQCHFDLTAHLGMSDDEEESTNWLAYHPLGSDLIHSMISHFAKFGDVQTAATVAGLYTAPEHLVGPYMLGEDGAGRLGTQNKGNYRQSRRLTVPKWWTTKGSGSPYHTVHGSDTQHGVVINPFAYNFARQHRSNSWSDSLDDTKVSSPSQDVINGSGILANKIGHHQQNQIYSPVNNGIQFLNGNHNNVVGTIKESSILPTNGSMDQLESYSNSKKAVVQISRGIMLEPTNNRFYDRFKKSYAEILFRWGLVQQRAEILKNLTEITESSSIARIGVDYSIECKTCGQSVRGPHCSTCKRMVSICSICHIPAKGLCTFCSACGHGGHASHMLTWFKRKNTCPSGCGCNCLTENTRIFK